MAWRPSTGYAAFWLVLAASGTAGADCPPVTVEVDNDVPGSGYSEVKPENWVSHNVEPCKIQYRYLSETAGDGTRIGKAIWAPKITVTGYYEVDTSFRASVNRSNHVDYVLSGDDGKTAHRTVNQQVGTGCTHVTVGTVFCNAGGACQLVLDGNNGQSPAADVTRFTLVQCGTDPLDGGSTSACDGIAANPKYEVCQSTPTTCAGVFNDGSGCVAYCAAAGMSCKARFGGGAGCSMEAPPALPCAPDGHLSDWCECEAAPAPDAGMADALDDVPVEDAPVDATDDVATDGHAGAGDAAGGAAGTGGTGGGAAGASPNGGRGGGVAGMGAGGASGGQSQIPFPSAGGANGSSGRAGVAPSNAVADSSGGCGCQAASPDGSVLTAGALALAWAVGRRRRTGR